MTNGAQTVQGGEDEEVEGGRVKHDSQHSQSDLKHSKNYWNRSETDVRECQHSICFVSCSELAGHSSD